MDTEVDWNGLLGVILAELDCQTGTIHRTAPDGKTLVLVCEIGVPEALLEKIRVIPFGKGIAGAAAERGEPVELCNLQQDLGGVAKPDARKTGVSGSLAVPVFSADTGAVTGTLGVGMASPHEFSPGEKRRLGQYARKIAGLFANKGA